MPRKATRAVGFRLSADDYIGGARARFADALRLSAADRWVGAIYLAGRAVEGLLRGLVRLEADYQSEGHDLRALLRRVRSLRLLRESDANQLDRVNEIAVLWFNNLRFCGPEAYRRHLKRIGRERRDGRRRIKGDPIKANGIEFLESCEAILSHGSRLWKRSRRSSSG